MRARDRVPEWKLAYVRKARMVRARLTDKVIAQKLGVSIYAVKKWGRAK